MSKSSLSVLTRSTAKSRDRFMAALLSKCPEHLHTVYDDEALSHLCLFLARVPEALDLAAAHTAKHGYTSMYALFKPYLDAQPDSEEAVQDLVYTTFLETLPRPLRTFLSQLALFRGGFTAESAECIFSVPCAREWCEELHALELLCKHADDEETRYSLLPSLQSYLKQTNPEEKQVLWKQAFAIYFADLAHAAAPHLQYSADPLWMARLNAEGDNLYAAVEMCRGAQRVEMVCNLWLWGWNRSDFARMHKAVLLAHGGCPDLPPQLVAEMHRASGVLMGRQGKREEALLFLRRGLKVAEDMGQIQRIPFFLNHLGVVLRQIGDYAEAEAVLQRGYALWNDQDNLPGQAIILNALATLYWAQNRLDEAYHTFAQATRICCEIRNDAIAARTLHNMAMVAAALQNYEAAVQSYLQSSACFAKVHDRRSEMQSLNNIAVIWYQRGKYRQAKEFFKRSLEITRQQGFFAEAYIIIAGMAQSEDRAGNTNRAAILFGAYDAFKEQYKSVPDLRFLEEIENHLGDLKRRVRPSTFTRLWKRGKTMSLDKIMETLFD